MNIYFQVGLILLLILQVACSPYRDVELSGSPTPKVKITFEKIVDRENEGWPVKLSGGIERFSFTDHSMEHTGGTYYFFGQTLSGDVRHDVDVQRFSASALFMPLRGEVFSLDFGLGVHQLQADITASGETRSSGTLSNTIFTPIVGAKIHVSKNFNIGISSELDTGNLSINSDIYANYQLTELINLNVGYFYFQASFDTTDNVYYKSSPSTSSLSRSSTTYENSTEVKLNSLSGVQAGITFTF